MRRNNHLESWKVRRKGGQKRLFGKVRKREGKVSWKVARCKGEKERLFEKGGKVRRNSYLESCKGGTKRRNGYLERWKSEKEQ